MLIEGRKYKIKKPKDTTESPVWCSEDSWDRDHTMDDYDNVIITYDKSMDTHRDNIISYDSWEFNHKWLHELDEKPILTFVLNLVK